MVQSGEKALRKEKQKRKKEKRQEGEVSEGCGICNSFKNFRGTGGQDEGSVYGRRANNGTGSCCTRFNGLNGLALPLWNCPKYAVCVVAGENWNG